MTVYGGVLLALAAGYFVLISAYVVGFRRVARRRRPASDDENSVSVVIAARNEEENVAACLESVLQSADAISEIIVVDDHSTDNTRCVVSDISARSAIPVRLIRLTDGDTQGKAFAIRRGVEAASGEIILSTDADCRARPLWAASMQSCFDPRVQFVSGPVRFANLNSLADRIQGLEFLGLVSIGAGGIGIAWPNMCNSANIAYRKSAYMRFAGEPDADLPNDEIMLQRLHAENPESVVFCASPEAVVATEPERTLRGFVHQRRRWAGTGVRYPSASLVAMIAGVYLFYVALFLAPIIGFWIPEVWYAFAVALTLKIVPEIALLVSAARHLRITSLVRAYPIALLLQVPYVVVIGVAGLLGGTSWKDRPMRVAG
jgi:cellulose synthase/poly-beta-1,6-N-acetylglucosamine synthase-like glycosyltransferase